MGKEGTGPSWILGVLDIDSSVIYLDRMIVGMHGKCGGGALVEERNYGSVAARDSHSVEELYVGYNATSDLR